MGLALFLREGSSGVPGFELDKRFTGVTPKSGKVIHETGLSLVPDADGPGAGETGERVGGDGSGGAMGLRSLYSMVLERTRLMMPFGLLVDEEDMSVTDGRLESDGPGDSSKEGLFAGWRVTGALRERGTWVPMVSPSMGGPDPGDEFVTPVRDDDSRCGCPETLVWVGACLLEMYVSDVSTPLAEV